MKSSRKFHSESCSCKLWPVLLVLFEAFCFLKMDLRGCIAFQRSTGVFAPFFQKGPLPYRKMNAGLSFFASSMTSEMEMQLIPLLDFRQNETIDTIDRLDDAIMGGISTSTIRQGKNWSIWSGICRTDGGGFCGFRTNPFRNPLLLNSTPSGNSYDGFYIICRLASDNEADRRIWKVTTRTKPDRGELLYQAPFHLNSVAFQSSFPSDNSLLDWQTVYVPFESFRLVRGPRIIENGAPLNISKGIYQIGMSMSKFLFSLSSNSTERTLDNFRDGYFEMHIQEIGVYATLGVFKDYDDSPYKADPNLTSDMLKMRPLSIYSKFEVKRGQPPLLKFLLVISKIFFSEQRYAKTLACACPFCNCKNSSTHPGYTYVICIVFITPQPTSEVSFSKVTK